MTRSQATTPSAPNELGARVRPRRLRRRSLAPYLWVLPALVLYTIFKLVPLVAGLWLALLRWDGIEEAKFVGLQNFQRMFSDENLGPALWHNVLYAFGTVIGKMVLALALAVLLNQALRGQAFYRTALFLPVVMSFVVVGILWSWLFNNQFGLINSLFRAIGLHVLALDWLGDTRIALWSLMLVDIWKWYGFHMVIFLAGLQTIPLELYDAARVDGANRRRQFTDITLPLLRPVMIVNINLALIGAIGVFDIPYVMTEGGPANSTNVVSLHIYIQAFKYYKLGYATALSYALLLLVVVIAAIQIRVMSRSDDGA